jgi:hypothetical protein
MGCSCNFSQSKYAEEKKIEFINNELNNIVETIRNNPNYLKLIIKIQSVYKGMRIRSIVKNIEKAPNKYDMNITSPSQLVESTNFYQHNKDQNFEEEFQEVLKEYEPLDDNIKVEIKGPLHFANNNTIYYGEWDPANKKRHGRGIQIWKEGSKYCGYWIDDKINKKGKIIYNDGNIYEGEWKDDKPNGKGKYTNIDGTVYEGNWKDDKQHGLGKEEWSDGAWYEGEYFEGKKQGKGKFHWADGSLYEGTFLDNNINGQGVYYFSDKRKYEGGWVNNQLEGKGIFTWPDGRRYDGEYKNDKKDGYGTFSWNDGKIYKGYWKNGKQHGNGQFFDPTDQLWKRGIWENGKKVKWLD